VVHKIDNKLFQTIRKPKTKPQHLATEVWIWSDEVHNKSTKLYNKSNLWNLIIKVYRIQDERYFKIVHPIKYRKKFRSWMNWIGVALPWVNGLINGVPLIVATTGFDRDNEFCRANARFPSPAAKKVGINFCIFKLLITILTCIFTPAAHFIYLCNLDIWPFDIRVDIVCVY